jgi:hypothetical protein
MGTRSQSGHAQSVNPPNPDAIPPVLATGVYLCLKAKLLEGVFQHLFDLQGRGCGWDKKRMAVS